MIFNLVWWMPACKLRPSRAPAPSRQTKIPLNILPDSQTTPTLPGFPFTGHKQAALAEKPSNQERPLTFAAPLCRPRGSRSGGRSAAPHPKDAPSGRWPPARLCPAERRPGAQLPRERRPRASSLSGAEDRFQDFTGQSLTSKHSLDLPSHSLRSVFCRSLPSLQPSHRPSFNSRLKAHTARRHSGLFKCRGQGRRRAALVSDSTILCVFLQPDALVNALQYSHFFSSLKVSFSTTASPALRRGCGGVLESIPAVSGWRRGHSPDRLPVHRRASEGDKQPFVFAPTDN